MMLFVFFPVFFMMHIFRPEFVFYAFEKPFFLFLMLFYFLLFFFLYPVCYSTFFFFLVFIFFCIIGRPIIIFQFISSSFRRAVHCAFMVMLGFFAFSSSVPRIAAAAVYVPLILVPDIMPFVHF